MSIVKWPQLLGVAGLAVAAVTIPLPAHASCISVFGLGNGNGTDGSSCVSGPFGIAIGIGPSTGRQIGRTVHRGPRSRPPQWPDRPLPSHLGGLLQPCRGPRHQRHRAATVGRLGLAVSQGLGGSVGNSVVAQAGLTPTDNVNVAVNVLARSATKINRTFAVGDGNLAADIGGDSTDAREQVVQAFGLGNIALAGRGDGNQVSAGNLTPGASDSGVISPTPSTLGLAFNALGRENTATAIGPLAVAGSVFGNGRNGLTGSCRPGRASP